MTDIRPRRTGKSKLTGKFQLTVPEAIRRVLKLQLGSEAIFRVLGKDRVEIRFLPPVTPARELVGSLKIPEEAKVGVGLDNLTKGLGDDIIKNFGENFEDNRR